MRKEASVVQEQAKDLAGWGAGCPASCKDPGRSKTWARDPRKELWPETQEGASKYVV